MAIALLESPQDLLVILAKYIKTIGKVALITVSCSGHLDLEVVSGQLSVNLME